MLIKWLEESVFSMWNFFMRIKSSGDLNASAGEKESPRKWSLSKYLVVSLERNKKVCIFNSGVVCVSVPARATWFVTTKISFVLYYFPNGVGRLIYWARRRHPGPRLWCAELGSNAHKPKRHTKGYLIKPISNER